MLWIFWSIDREVHRHIWSGQEWFGKTQQEKLAGKETQYCKEDCDHSNIPINTGETDIWQERGIRIKNSKKVIKIWNAKL